MRCGRATLACEPDGDEASDIGELAVKPEPATFLRTAFLKITSQWKYMNKYLVTHPLR